MIRTRTLEWRTNRTGRLAVIVVAILAVASLAACADEDEPLTEASPSPSDTSTMTPDASPSATPSPPAGIATYAPETRTGNGPLDEILVSVLAADAQQIGRRLRFMEVQCGTAAKGIPGPECPPGAAAGTAVAVFPLTGCETTYERADVIGPVVEGFVGPGLQLFAAYHVDPSSTGNLAPGDFGLVFVDGRPTPGDVGAIMVDVGVDADGGIVRWASSCGTTTPPEFMGERPVLDYLLPPQ